MCVADAVPAAEHQLDPVEGTVDRQGVGVEWPSPDRHQPGLQHRLVLLHPLSRMRPNDRAGGRPNGPPCQCTRPWPPRALAPNLQHTRLLLLLAPKRPLSSW
jgi:hypothetical protein